MTVREGSLEAPTRHPIDWRNPEYRDEAKIVAEMERVFDICHGCRRCVSLCQSFPTLFDLVDESESMEVDGVGKDDYWKVVDHCYLCDLCYMTKCPYVPPHEFNLDFPHLMLRYRAVEMKKHDYGFAELQLTETDRNGRLAGSVAPIANWASRTGNGLTRPVLEAVAGVLPARDAHRGLNADPRHGRPSVFHVVRVRGSGRPRERGHQDHAGADRVDPGARAGEEGDAEPAEVEEQRERVALRKQDADRVQQLRVLGVEPVGEDGLGVVQARDGVAMGHFHREGHVVPEGVEVEDAAV